MLNLDTHIVLHALSDRLTPSERRILGQDAWSMSAICLWEFAKLRQLGRIEIDLDDADVTRALAKIHVWPLTLAICRAIANLDFKGDPADELIAATSIVEGVPLVTRDRRIRRSRLVPLAR
jgi:PIN domain nuclease of toxin-antitoxin system